MATLIHGIILCALLIFPVISSGLVCLRRVVFIVDSRLLQIHKVTRKESLLTLEAIKDLMEQGMNLAPHESVEKALTQTQLLLNDADRWEEKARICLHARLLLSPVWLDGSMCDS